MEILEGYIYKSKSLKGVELPPRSLRKGGGINKTLAKPMIHVLDILLVFDVKKKIRLLVVPEGRKFNDTVKEYTKKNRKMRKWKDGNARFTAVTLKALSVQE